MSKKRILEKKHQDISPGFKIIFAPKNTEQEALLKTIAENTITFVRGPAGCGKSHVPIAYALQKLIQNKYEKIILVRPIVEGGGERLGWLPGEVLDKVKHYFSPMVAIMSQILGSATVKTLMSSNDGKPGDGQIQIIPIAYMRGITVSNSILLLDEAQNCTLEQMRLLLTRIGENSKFIIGGDPEQSDIAPSKNGLEACFRILQNIKGIGFTTMTEESIVRHPLIQKMEERFRKEKESFGKPV